MEELETLTLGSLRKAVMDGDVKGGSLMAGQIAGLVRQENTCEEIMEEMINGAEKLFSNIALLAGTQTEDKQ